MITAFFVFSSLAAQEQRFNAGLVLGLNASQIDGDQLAGFDKLGLTGGVRGIARLSEKVAVNVEFLYSERGSKPDALDAIFEPDIHIDLTYAEVPFYFSFKDWKITDYYKVQIHTGISFARLINASTIDGYEDDELELDTLVDEFNSNDLSFLIGASFNFSRSIGVNLRYTRFINKLLNTKTLGINAPSLRSYFLTFRLEYTI